MSKIYYKKSNFYKLSWNNKKNLKSLEISLKNDNVSIVSTDTILQKKHLKNLKA